MSNEIKIQKCLGVTLLLLLILVIPCQARAWYGNYSAWGQSVINGYSSYYGGTEYRYGQMYPYRYQRYNLILGDGYRYQEVKIDQRTGRMYFGRIRRFR